MNLKKIKSLLICFPVLFVLAFSPGYLGAQGKSPGKKPTQSHKAKKGVVKKSKNGICHSAQSKYYKRIKKFKPYKTIGECIKSGGRPPKKSASKGSNQKKDPKKNG